MMKYSCYSNTASDNLRQSGEVLKKQSEKWKYLLSPWHFYSCYSITATHMRARVRTHIHTHTRSNCSLLQAGYFSA